MKKGKRSPYYKTCPECGAHLDPQERCDCQEQSLPTTDNTDDTAA